MLPVSFLFTHSFCFLIALACLWFWLNVASILPPGTLTVSALLLTRALGVFWIKFPRESELVVFIFFLISTMSEVTDWLPLGQIPTALPPAELGESRVVRQPWWQCLSFPLKRINASSIETPALFYHDHLPFPGMFPYLLHFNTYLFQRSIKFARKNSLIVCTMKYFELCIIE